MYVIVIDCKDNYLVVLIVILEFIVKTRNLRSFFFQKKKEVGICAKM